MKLEGPIFFGSPGDSRACSAMALPAETREANQQQGYYKNGCGWLLYALRPCPKALIRIERLPETGPLSCRCWYLELSIYYFCCVIVALEPLSWL